MGESSYSDCVGSSEKNPVNPYINGQGPSGLRARYREWVGNRKACRRLRQLHLSSGLPFFFPDRPSREQAAIAGRVLALQGNSNVLIRRRC